MAKKIASIFMAAAIMVIACMPAAFAANGFTLEKSSPANGYNRVQAQNVMIKLYFSGEVYDSGTQAANKDKFKFTDSNGKAVKYKIYYDESDRSKISILSVKDLKMEETYTLTISGDLISDDGQTLGADEVIKFTTKSASGGMVYGLLMVAMIVVMVFITIRDQRKAMQEEELASGVTIQTNPYKMAREKGISVEEANRIIAKEKEKAAKKDEKRRQKEQAEREARIAAEKAARNVHRVHTKRIVKRK